MSRGDLLKGNLADWTRWTNPFRSFLNLTPDLRKLGDAMLAPTFLKCLRIDSTFCACKTMSNLKLPQQMGRKPVRKTHSNGYGETLWWQPCLENGLQAISIFQDFQHSLRAEAHLLHTHRRIIKAAWEHQPNSDGLQPTRNMQEPKTLL